MKHLICGIIIVLLTCSVVRSAEMIKCTGELSDKQTKDGFGRITLVCEHDVVINKGKPLYMYANGGMIVFSQEDVEWPITYPADQGDFVSIKPFKKKVVK